jgi:predicted PurR-regulated permease PerM
MARFAEFNHPEMEAWLNRVLPEDFDLAQTVLGPVQSGLVSVGTTLTSAVPTILSSIVTGFIDGVIFLFAVITLYMEGPRVLAFLAKLSPMDDDYERQLFEVFRELANNLVVGSLVTAAIQGMIATLGYYIAGVDRVIFVGLLTAVFSFFPLVGTAVVWLPVAVYTGATVSVGWGLFVAAWSLLFTGTVDNFVKPLFLRGSSDIHPLLIFLAVFGGLGWMGLPGVLVGPVIVAGFLSLYTMYSQDFVTALSEEE